MKTYEVDLVMDKYVVRFLDTKINLYFLLWRSRLCVILRFMMVL